MFEDVFSLFIFLDLHDEPEPGYIFELFEAKEFGERYQLLTIKDRISSGEISLGASDPVDTTNYYDKISMN